MLPASFKATALLALGFVSLSLVPQAHAQAKPVLTTLHTFDSTQGAYPQAPLVPGSDGNLYGTTYGGGLKTSHSYGSGTVFRLNPTTHQFTTLYKFDGKSGDLPNGLSAQGSDGSFYGTTVLGGRSQGTLFRITPDGRLTYLHQFRGRSLHDGAFPTSAPLLGADGALYGTTYQGGLYSSGALYRLTTAGVLTVLHDFNGPEGANPVAGLVQGPDGTLYGASTHGGRYGHGTFFLYAPDKQFHVLRSITDKDISTVLTPLVFGPDGALYGSGRDGGHGSYGGLFRLGTNGEYTALHMFSTDGHGNHGGGLTLGPDGNFYGIASYGGIDTNNSNGWGAVFRMTPEGQSTTLYKFNGGIHGGYPDPVTFSPDGALYGITEEGGSSSGNNGSGYGTLYKLTLPQ